MSAAGYDVRENDPFADKPSLVFAAREISPYVNRIRFLWQKMREPVIDRFPKAPGLPRNIEAYMKRVNDAYVTDAYHSLSIEGYRVTRRADRTRPQRQRGIRSRTKAIGSSGTPWRRAATGWLIRPCREASGRVLRRENAGLVADEDHRDVVSGTVCAERHGGLLKPADLAGYRNGQVYIRKSMHVPLNCEAVRDAMPAFFDLLREETHPAVRVVLGHFVFVYIHPYMDGNGRIGRFLMNVMMASGGYPWTSYPSETATPI